MSGIKVSCYLQAILPFNMNEHNFSVAKRDELLYCLGRYELLSIKFHFAYG